MHVRYDEEMAVNITIRSVPDEVRGVLAERARSEGRSLQEYLSRELASLAARPSVNDVLARARQGARELPSLSPGDVARAIDADRR